MVVQALPSPRLRRASMKLHTAGQDRTPPAGLLEDRGIVEAPRDPGHEQHRHLLQVLAQVGHGGADPLGLGRRVVDLRFGPGAGPGDVGVHAGAVEVGHLRLRRRVLDEDPLPELLVGAVGRLERQLQALLDDRPRDRPRQVEAAPHRPGRRQHLVDAQLGHVRPPE